MLTDNPNVPLILVVEDDDDHAGLIKRSFEDAPEEYRLEFVCSLGDAHKSMERRLPHLVLSDYRLPDGDGSKLVGMVDGACPVVLMTAQGNEQLAVEAMKAGAQDYIVKSPETFVAMSRAVHLALREWDLIQERRRMYEAVSRGKREWEQTFDAVSDLIAIIDTHYTISRVNRAMANRCGLTPVQLQGCKCYELFHDTTSPPDFCPHARMLRDGREHTEELEVKKLSGFFEITVSPLYDDEGGIIACVHVARDISERKKAEEVRQEMERQLQQAQKLESLGVLAGGIAHDFNNILTIILGHCFILKEERGYRATHTALVQNIENAAVRAADLCRQMLTYAGKSPLLQTQVNVWELVDETVKMLKSAIKKNVSIELDLTHDVPVITGDKAKIQQIVMNLIINAAEAIADGNGTVRVELSKTGIEAGQVETDFLGHVIREGRYACLQVSDTGCGIDHEAQKRIFEPFFTTKMTGRGLGMSAVLGIIKSHDGALQFSSTPGTGTTFKVYLPLAVIPDRTETGQEHHPAPPVQTNGSILLVDDEEALRSVGSELLSVMGFLAITASNGREALDVYFQRGDEIDLVLLDLIMPEMGGVETYRELRKINPTVPVVICSGYGIDEVSDIIEKDSHAGFLHKPYLPDQLRNSLTQLLGNAG